MTADWHCTAQPVNIRVYTSTLHIAETIRAVTSPDLGYINWITGNSSKINRNDISFIHTSNFSWSSLSSVFRLPITAMLDKCLAGVDVVGFWAGMSVTELAGRWANFDRMGERTVEGGMGLDLNVFLSIGCVRTGNWTNLDRSPGSAKQNNINTASKSRRR